MNDLLNSQQFAKFRAKDPEWFLDVVAQTITDHCYWHIAPSVSVTGLSVPLGGKGIALLPSLHVTSVEAVRLNGALIDPRMYELHTEGWVEMVGFLKPPRNTRISVDFTHGYDETPKSVAEVGYELAATVIEKASGVVTDLTRGPTVMKFKEFGVVLSPGQEHRLSPYRLRRV